jgi:hypothetical protein
MAFATMISKKLTHAQQHSVQISYTKYHPNWTLGVETTGRTSFTAYIAIKPTQQQLHGNSLFQISSKSVNKYDQFMPLTKV